MDEAAERAALAALVAGHGESYARLSRLIGRNAAYLQQYVSRGSPRRLDERDRGLIARYFGVPEAALGGPEPAGLVEVPRLDVAASAGPGAFDDGEAARRPGALAPALLRGLGVRAAAASMIRVEGESMAPTLEPGDEILVDRDRARVEGRGGIFVARIGGALVVKRLRSAVGGIEVASDNPDYVDVVKPAREVEVIGRVVWLSRPVR